MEHQGAQINNRNHHHHHPYNGGGGGGGREDCWTEAATAILIEAWGDRYLALSRGNLRQKDWKDVADAVNGRSDGLRPRRTDIQCKNRIDTIKKKYKLEKSKPAPSQWPFYSRLDHLIGTTTPPANNRKTTTPRPPPPPLPLSLTLPSYVNKPPAVTFTVKQGKGKMYNHNSNPNLNAGVYSGGSSSKSRLNSPDSTESSGGAGVGDEEEDEEEEEEDDDDDVDAVFNNGSARKHQMGRDSSDGAPFRELAKAVLKFGEIYERIENSKQQQMMELERQKMEFTKDLEFQRMQMFMEAQLELEKMKRPKNASTTGKKL